MRCTTDIPSLTLPKMVSVREQADHVSRCTVELTIEGVRKLVVLTFPVQVRRGCEGEEELTAVGIGPGVSHCEDACASES
jgi:hypothetical protein